MADQLRIPDDYWKPSGTNLLAGLVGLGGLTAGIYYGVMNAKGIPVDSGLEFTLKYAPAIAGGAIGLKKSYDI